MYKLYIRQWPLWPCNVNQHESTNEHWKRKWANGKRSCTDKCIRLAYRRIKSCETTIWAVNLLSYRSIRTYLYICINAKTWSVSLSLYIYKNYMYISMCLCVPPSLSLSPSPSRTPMYAEMYILYTYIYTHAVFQ